MNVLGELRVYCLKCKQQTLTNNVEHVISKNNRNMIKGICSICGTKKNKFMKSNVSSIKTGRGFLNNAIEKLGQYNIELHLAADKGENVPNGSFNDLQKYSYAGPGTKYVQRNREGYKGINELDRMAKLHDQFYNEHSDTKSRNISDIALAHRAEEIASDPNIDETQRRDAKFVKTLMQNKARFGFGLAKPPKGKKSKN